MTLRKSGVPAYAAEGELRMGYMSLWVYGDNSGSLLRPEVKAVRWRISRRWILAAGDEL